MTFGRTLLSAALACAVAGSAAADSRTLTLTTKSDTAKTMLRELQVRIESFRGGAQAQELAKKIVEADPEFAMGMYYLSAVTPPPEGPKHLLKAVELAKNASEGERRFIEAMQVARGPKPADAEPLLRKLAEDFPGERTVWMVLGQNLNAQGKLDDARAAFEKAVALDAATPRAHVFLGNYYTLKGEYAKAREMYAKARPLFPKGAPTTQVSYSIAFTHLYEGQPDEAIKVLAAAVENYRTSDRIGDLPEVFLWNSIARIHLEHGRPEEAMKAYEKGFESVPGSKLSEDDKKIWLGRLHHGKGRTLARMGRHAEAWQEAETIKKMIDEGGERGTRFVPAYHYIAGYLKLEAKDYAAAVEHLQKADMTDPFHKLLLARAYEQTGRKDEAKKLYAEIVAFSQNNLERALAYPEAKKRLAAL